MSPTRPKIAVVGHVEWVLFGRAAAPPTSGAIVHLAEPFEEPAGGGAVAAIALARAGAEVVFVTALANDAEGAATRERMLAEGIDLRVSERAGRQARAVTILDDTGDRTIIVSQPNEYPRGDDPLGWASLADCSAVYATCGEPSGIAAARTAGSLVCSARQLQALIESGVKADVVVSSLTDRGEEVDFRVLGKHTNAIVLTDGDRGGRWMSTDDSGLWDAVSLPGDPVDAYGAGDCFAAGLTYGLGLGLPLAAAVQTGAAWGAETVCRRGPYGTQA